MKKHEIEAWVLEVAERVDGGKQIEDSRVELKAEWPTEVKKAARQIAGLCNAARGQEVLWVIGIDEKRGVIGASKTELSTWFAQVQSEIDGVYPQVEELVITVPSGQTVVALLFDTSRAPFIVKNPDGGMIKYEVPWREATGTRTATRADLVKILSPVASIPEFEVLNGTLTLNRGSEPNPVGCFLGVDIYAYPKSKDLVAIPYHQLAIKVSLPEYLLEAELNLISMKPTQRTRNVFPGAVQSYFPPTESASKTIDSTDSELLIYGPGKFHISANAGVTLKHAGESLPANVSILLGFADLAREVTINFDLAPAEAKEDLELARWQF
jgi:hypothetical protein